jgi:hypothetical protein
MSDKRQEMDDEHRERSWRLYRELSHGLTYVRPDQVPPSDLLAAYNAVLLKDLLRSVNELLTYKQNEVHQ